MTVGIFDGISNYHDDASIFQGANGIEIIVDVVEDISDAIECTLNVHIPIADENAGTDYTHVIWQGEPYLNHHIRYILKTEDTPVTGFYRIYAQVRWLDGRDILGETAMLNVRARGE